MEMQKWNNEAKETLFSIEDEIDCSGCGETLTETDDIFIDMIDKEGEEVYCSKCACIKAGKIV